MSIFYFGLSFASSIDTIRQKKSEKRHKQENCLMSLFVSWYLLRCCCCIVHRKHDNNILLQLHLKSACKIGPSIHFYWCQYCLFRFLSCKRAVARRYIFYVPWYVTRYMYKKKFWQQPWQLRQCEGIQDKKATFFMYFG